MRKVGRTLVIALLLSGATAVTSGAQTSRGAGNISTAAQNFTPIAVLCSITPMLVVNDALKVVMIKWRVRTADA